MRIFNGMSICGANWIYGTVIWATSCMLVFWSIDQRLRLLWLDPPKWRREVMLQGSVLRDYSPVSGLLFERQVTIDSALSMTFPAYTFRDNLWDSWLTVLCSVLEGRVLVFLSEVALVLQFVQNSNCHCAESYVPDVRYVASSTFNTGI